MNDFMMKDKNCVMSKKEDFTLLSNPKIRHGSAVQ
jgi:hypothetical protein